MQFFLFFFFPLSQNGEQNSDMNVVAFCDLLITCYVSGNVLYAGDNKANERAGSCSLGTCVL